MTSSASWPYACAAQASDAAAPARTDGILSVRWSNQRSYRRGSASRASAGYASTNLLQARHAASRTCNQAAHRLLQGPQALQCRGKQRVSHPISGARRRIGNHKPAELRGSEETSSGLVQHVQRIGSTPLTFAKMLRMSVEWMAVAAASAHRPAAVLGGGQQAA